MYSSHRSTNPNFPPVVKNIIIISTLMLLITWVLEHSFGIDLTRYLALYYPGSEYFHPYQFVTHLFMHAGLVHLFFNMFALWMFGRVLENVWGGKRFFIFYFVTGIGAAGFYTLVHWIEYTPMIHFASSFASHPTPDLFLTFIQKYVHHPNPQVYQFIDAWRSHLADMAYANQAVSQTNNYVHTLINIPTIGASGAVFGVLLAFGMLFPNTQLMLLFPPIPIKAKYFVLGYGALEFYLALAQPGGHIAHVAHLGGMLFGYIMVKYWNKKGTNFY